jgi:hypothetical protein
MNTEVVGTLTHADAPQRFAINRHMKLFFAGATHAGQSRVREQIRMTLKTPKQIAHRRLEVLLKS